MVTYPAGAPPTSNGPPAAPSIRTTANHESAPLTLFAYIPVGPDTGLLEAHLAWARTQGVDRILLDLHLRSADDTVALRDLHRRARAFDAEIANVHSGHYDGLVARRERCLASRCGNADWVVVSDLDEFPRFPMALDELIALCAQDGYDYVCGMLRDRVTADGELAELSSGDPAGQFPLVADITGAIMGAWKYKVPLIRPGVRLTEGQHHALNGTGCPAALAHVTVDHYKWSAGVHGRSREMKARPVGVATAGEAWRLAEHARLQEFLESGGMRIDIHDPRLDTYCPGESAYRAGSSTLTLPREPRRDPVELARRPRVVPAGAMPLLPPELHWLRDRLDGNLNVQQLAVLHAERAGVRYMQALGMLDAFIGAANAAGVVDFPPWRPRPPD